uniref:DNA repair protein recN n=1 Tax=Zeugodacus cucurbitae TaxID=28588 RepID=A0A0A1XEY3_ZEUCU
MVNELNKPPSQENLALGERLLDSQRQLQEMQEEHRQLLQEMEALRQRAAALSRLNEQQFSHVGDQRREEAPTLDTHADNTTQQQRDNTPLDATVFEEQGGTTTASSPNDAVEQSANLNTDTNQTINSPDNDEDDDDPETAAYLQKKLAEIAQLKARFKHVQNIMNTTEKIEEHIATKGVPKSGAATTALERSLDKLIINDSFTEVQSPCVTSTTTIPANSTKLNEDDTNIENEVKKYENTTNDEEQTINSYAPTQVANEELLSAMMNMFSDFTADLRSQADDLRAERDRLRALKEDLLRRKRQS